MQYLYQTERSTTPPEVQLPYAPLALDVRKRGFDSFFLGLAVGAAAAIAGVLLGLFLF